MKKILEAMSRGNPLVKVFAALATIFILVVFYLFIKVDSLTPHDFSKTPPTPRVLNETSSIEFLDKVGQAIEDTEKMAETYTYEEPTEEQLNLFDLQSEARRLRAEYLRWDVIITEMSKKINDMVKDQEHLDDATEEELRKYISDYNELMGEARSKCASYTDSYFDYVGYQSKHFGDNEDYSDRREKDLKKCEDTYKNIEI